MINSNEHPRANNTGAIRRRRSALMAGAFGLGLTGTAVGGLIHPAAIAADAQESQSQATATANVPPASFAPIVEEVSPAVVSIRVRGEREDRRLSGLGGFDFGQGLMPNLPEDHPLHQWFRRFGEGDRFGGRDERQPRRFGMSQGSGFFISADGYLVTNNHVVENGSQVRVVLQDGEEYEAEVVGTDPKTDLALLKIDAERDFPFVEFTDEEPRIGDWAVAVGNPFGLGGSVSAGIISADGRNIGAGPYDDFIQIDASINRGNSGGPTFNLDGEVIGVNTAIYSPSGGSVGIGFAIPADVVQTVVAELKEDGEVTRGWLGVAIQPVTDDIADALDLDETRGAIVAEPQPDSPAAEAGIRAGDVIVGLDGEEIEDARDLSFKVSRLDPGQAVEFDILRDGDRRTVEVEIGRMEDSDAGAVTDRGGEGSEFDDLGLTLAPADSVAGAGEEGVLVTEVDPSGPAAEKGVQAGDVILEVGGETVSSAQDVTEALREAQDGGRSAVLMLLRTDERTRFVAVTLPGQEQEQEQG